MTPQMRWDRRAQHTRGDVINSAGNRPLKRNIVDRLDASPAIADSHGSEAQAQ